MIFQCSCDTFNQVALGPESCAKKFPLICLQTDPTNDPPNFCSAADTDYIYSDELDSDGNPTDFIELYWYEDDCFTLPNTGSPDVMKRWYSLYEKVGGLTAKRSVLATQGDEDYDLPQLCEGDDCYTVPKLHSEEFRELLWAIGNATEEDSDGIFGGLFPRARKPKICQNKKTISTFKAKNYPSVGTLSATRQFYGVVKSGAKTAICNGLPITLGKRILGTNYVVEHVTELQTPAQFATSMLSGKLPSGAAAPGTASNYDWTQVFSQNGYFFQTWAQLGVTQPTGLTGDTPAEAIANALGSTADISNLQILDAPTNGFKAAVRMHHELNCISL